MMFSRIRIIVTPPLTHVLDPITPFVPTVDPPILAHPHFHRRPELPERLRSRPRIQRSIRLEHVERELGELVARLGDGEGLGGDVEEVPLGVE
jgi:hypothetical protein